MIQDDIVKNLLNHCRILFQFKSYMQWQQSQMACRQSGDKQESSKHSVNELYGPVGAFKNSTNTEVTFSSTNRCITVLRKADNGTTLEYEYDTIGQLIGPQVC